MNEMRAKHLTDQITAAYIDPQAGDVFSQLDMQAMKEMTDEQWSQLQQALSTLRPCGDGKPE